MAFTFIFKRVEKKYMLTKEQYEYIREALADHMHEDKYSDSMIRNIYFDNEIDELIETSLQKPVYKEKLRLRAYGDPTLDSTVFFEIKKKYEGIVYKRRVSMKLWEAYDYLKTGRIPDYVDGNIPKEIDYMVNRYHLEPKAYIGYHRIALTDNEDPNLRITFDDNIVSRYSDIRLESKKEGKQLLPEGHYLMEIKVPGAMPMWLARILSEGQIFSHSFSKIGTAHVQRKVAAAQIA